MRLIDADELKELMYGEAFETNSDRARWDSGLWIRYKMFEEHCDKCPTIEAEPIRHGHWDADADGYADGELVYDHWFCSECGWDDGGFLEEKPNYKYCPRCGSKMDNAGGGK